MADGTQRSCKGVTNWAVLVNCKAALSPEMAIRIGKATRTTPESWLSMQAKLDLWRAAGKPTQGEMCFGGLRKLLLRDQKGTRPASG